MIYSEPYYCDKVPRLLHTQDRDTKAVYVCNEGDSLARLGSYRVDLFSGLLLGPGMMVVLESDAELAQDWYAVSEGTSICVTKLT